MKIQFAGAMQDNIIATPSILNQTFKSQSYSFGYSPTQEDSNLFESINNLESFVALYSEPSSASPSSSSSSSAVACVSSSYPYLTRWYRHIESFPKCTRLKWPEKTASTRAVAVCLTASPRPPLYSEGTEEKVGRAAWDTGAAMAKPDLGAILYSPDEAQGAIDDIQAYQQFLVNNWDEWDGSWY